MKYNRIKKMEFIKSENRIKENLKLKISPSTFCTKLTYSSYYHKGIHFDEKIK